jgi:ectoine hydroxylase-related dioxygenase (phytanoyl-CoA dioxygenase family)
MDDTQRYMFDLQGYVVLKNVLPQAQVRRLKEIMDELEQRRPDEYPKHVVQSKPRTEQELYISNIIEAAPEFHALIDVPEVIDVIKEVSLGLFRLNHTYAIYHWKGSMTPLHMAGTPIHPKASYMAKNGQIFSLLTKAVFPIANHSVEDGCFGIVPGSHKSEFPRPFPDDPLSHPALVPIAAEPGDAIVFTEATTHGSYKNVSGRCRQTLYYCYSVGYMPDWSKLGLTFSDNLYNEVSPQQKEILRLKVA